VKIVVDTYAWVELFIGSEKGLIVKENLGSAEEVYTPDIVLAELARKYRRKGVEASEVEERLSKISVKNYNHEKKIATKAAEVDCLLREKAKKMGLREPSLIDAIVLATAKSLNANLITGDRHFKEEPETIWIGDG
jgi:predicted nucleic acid-binding protein